MFRRTAADLQRVSEMLAGDATGGDVANRLTLEGMPRQRAEWLVWRAKQERRLFVVEKPPHQIDWDPHGIVPEELAAPPPRHVRVRKKAMPVMLFIMAIAALSIVIGIWGMHPGEFKRPVMIVGGALLLLFAPYFLRVAKRQERIDVDLATNGSVAVADVLGFRMPFFRVRYRFQGIENEAGLRYPPSFPPAAGDRIVILYDPADPGINLPADALNVEFV